MITKFEHFKLTEASVFPMKEYVVSHVTTWLTSKYKKTLINLLMKQWGIKLTELKQGLEVNQELEHLCHERGIEILDSIDGLSIVVRDIHANGKTWIQISGSEWIKMPDDKEGKPVYSISRGRLGSLIDVTTFHDKESPVVIKNMKDVVELSNKAIEQYGHTEKKGYNKEIGEIAKEMNFKVEWDLDAINKISKKVLTDIKIAARKQKVRNEPRPRDSSGQVLDYDYGL